jgi:predicted MPP superfamily phosphohydrolase
VEPISSWLTGLGVTAGAGLAYSAGYEVRAYTLREKTVPVLPANAESFKILHLSDLHMTPRQFKKQEWISKLAELKPDLVVVTGDFLAHLNSVPSVLGAFSAFAGIPGVFVFGSNDYFAPSLKNPARYLFKPDNKLIGGVELPWQDLKTGLEEMGWIDLTHIRTELTIKNTRVEFRGVDDPHLLYDDYSTVAGRPNGNSFAIGVTHAPYLRVLDAMVEDEIPLILAGHTHGGQLCLPFFGALVTNCDLDTRRAKGLHKYQDAWLHVSAGLGTNPFTPVRFACRPEATLLTLTAAN